METNPLSTIVIIFVIGDIFTTWQAINKHSVSLLTVVAWVQCVGLVVLYLKPSRFAGAYLFYSTAPITPIYLLLKLTGMSPPLVPGVYVFAFIAYLFAMVLLWKIKRNYERFIARREADPTT
jgi:uncharacterized membrane protein YozB (DUF420 family)